MIRIEKLRKTFLDGDHRHVVLDDLDLEIAAGEFAALLGRSGSGKSTLLNCIAGIERPDAGLIRLGDVDLTRLSDRQLTHLRRDRIGIVFQFFNLLPMLPVIENVALPALLRGDRPGEVRRRAMGLLEELELADRADDSPDHLSGGEQQRVATARALINDPDLLLADEPTGNLDATTAERTLQLLREVNARHGVTILMVTHSPEAAAIAGRVIGLVDGRVQSVSLREPQSEGTQPGERPGPPETAATAPPSPAAGREEPRPEPPPPPPAPRAQLSAKARALLKSSEIAEASFDRSAEEESSDPDEKGAGPGPRGSR